MKKLAASCLALILAAGPAAAQTAALTRIGVAAAVRGKVQALAPTPKAVGRIIGSGKELYLNDKVTTGPDARLQIMLLDETVFTIGANSSMVLDEFVYDPKSDSGKVSARVLKGVFRFITGRLAKKDPSTMKVGFPIGTVGIRGTIVAGQVMPNGQALVVLLGPGAGNNAGERAGSFSMENAGVKVVVSQPGFGTHVDNLSSPPSPPVLIPQSTLNSLAASLAPAPAPSGSSGGAGAAGDTSGGTGGTSGGTGGTSTTDTGPSATDLSGQGSASAGGSLTTTQSIGTLTQTLTNTSQTASQTSLTTAPPGFPDGTSTWDQVRTIPSGVGTFSASGPFTLTQCNGTACIAPSSLNSWNYNVSVDFGARQISGTSQIAAYANNATVVDNHTISMSFAGLAGNATFCCKGSGAVYNFVLQNASGFAAKQLQGAATYDNSATNPSNATKGAGATLTSTRP